MFGDGEEEKEAILPDFNKNEKQEIEKQLLMVVNGGMIFGMFFCW